MTDHFEVTSVQGSRGGVQSWPAGTASLVSVPFTALVFLTLGFSIYSFGKGWGSMWCWIVNGMVVLGALKSAFAGVRSRTAERLP